jgi:adenylate cyclase
MPEPYVERERKFIVTNLQALKDLVGVGVRQGYFIPNADDPQASFRVRIKHDPGAKGVKPEFTATLTMKRLRVDDRRDEFEYLIDVDAAEDLLSNFCVGRTIEKKRYGWTDEWQQQWDLDFFEGENAGLVLAEYENESDLPESQIPSILGGEVTNDDRYYNEYLSVHPISTWNDPSAPHRL